MEGAYWDESACYRFAGDQVDALETATNELHRMCLDAAKFVVRENRFAQLGIAPAAATLIQTSLENNEPSVYGRFDFCYDGTSPPKLLEYNADTPTALFEASVVQWHWLKDCYPAADQFNSIHEKLIERWKQIGARLPKSDVVYFACVKDHLEDFSTTEYLRDTAAQAGLATAPVFIEDIGLDEPRGIFVDDQNSPIHTVFKLYPWEWMLAEEFGEAALGHPWRIIEPPWKMLLSNKGLLAILWELYPDHPNLLPTFFDPAPFGSTYVKKPLLSREGANVSVVQGALAQESAGAYGAEGFVYQAFHPLPAFNGHHAVIGSWIVGSEAAGIGIREDKTLVTQNTSRFVPHFFE